MQNPPSRSLLTLKLIVYRVIVLGCGPAVDVPFLLVRLLYQSA